LSTAKIAPGARRGRRLIVQLKNDRLGFGWYILANYDHPAFKLHKELTLMTDVNKDDAITFARELVGNDPLARFLGIEVVTVNQQETVVALTPQPHHLNGMGVVHGSAMYALLDQAAAIASNAFGYRAILRQTSINFLVTAAADRRLRASARPLSVKRRLSLWEIKIKDDRDNLVASGQATAYHFV
jgi:acyl-CoA thioesterase